MTNTLTPLDEKIAALCWGEEGRRLSLDAASIRLAEWNAEEGDPRIGVDRAREVLQQEAQAQRLRPASGPTVGEVIRTVERLSACPIDTVLACAGGAAAKRHQWGRWQVTGCVEALDLSDAWLPARVLDLPASWRFPQ